MLYILSRAFSKISSIDFREIVSSGTLVYQEYGLYKYFAVSSSPIHTMSTRNNLKCDLDIQLD